jgi:hypothetical protein
MLINILGIGLELPYTFGACFQFLDRETPTDKIVSYGEMLHQLNLGILKLFQEYSMIEMSVNMLFYNEFMLSGYFGSTFLLGLIQLGVVMF